MPGPDDFFLNCCASIASDLVWGAIREARYCCCFNNFVKDLKREKEELLKYKERVDEDVKRANKETKKIDNDYQDWLEEADILEEQVENLESKVEKYKSCCLGHCPNWICRYLLGRKLAKKKDDVKLHCDERPKDGIKRLATLQGMEYFSSENFMIFKSRELAHQQLMEAIQDDGVSMIGLYGMGGSGKTTLEKEVGKEVEQLNYKVVFVVVSREGVRRIQDKIASSLKFELNEKEEIERAKRLSMRLRNNDEMFLIILDDVWEKLDFEAIGIPFGENCKSCKVLITTRSFDVCNLMDCQKTIPLSLLSFEESWTLFQKHARITNETSDALQDLAKQITKKCGGLPIANVAVANTLKGKPQDEWEVALKTLKDSRPMDIEEGLRDPYTCLELSFNSLKSKEAKSLFLLCSAFPEDWNIDVELLTRYAIGLGMFGRATSSYKMARQQMNVAKNKLINSCLLLKVDHDEECVKMHDLVRDVALWIANKENKVILGPERCENVMEEGMTVKDNQIRYISCCKLPRQLDCSELEFLYVRTDSEQVQVPCGYFKGKEKLRVLVLENEDWQDIPVNLNSIQTLIGLRCLVLINWELEDISHIGCLQALESLALKSCSFQKLPEAIELLTNLRLLEVSNCTIEMNLYEAIGKYSYLEELYFVQNDGYEGEFNDETASELLGKFSAPQQLQRYHVEFGKRKKDFNMVGGSIKRILDIEYFDASTSSAAIMDLVGKAEALSLGHIKGGRKNVIPDIVRRVTDLIELIIYDSEEIQCLIDNTNLYCQVESFFSKLSRLHISRMLHLEALCHGRPSPILFEKLEDIYISGCNELHGVLFVGQLNLCNLRVLKVKNCLKLSSIFTLDSARSLSQLQCLVIDRCDELKHIMIEKVNKEITKDDNDRMIKLPNLKLIKLSYLSSIVSIFLGNCIPVWPSLQLLHLDNCPQFTIMTPHECVATCSEVRQHESPPMEMGPLIIHDNQKSDEMSRLQTLLDIETLDVTKSNIKSIFHISGLPLNTELNYMWSLDLCNLKRLHLYDCPMLKSLFTLSTVKTLRSLENLIVSECHVLKEIINCESPCGCKKEESGFQSHFSILFPKLKDLTIADCDSLECIFPVPFNQGPMELRYISIWKAPQLRYLFGEGSLEHYSSHQSQNIIQIKLPVLEELALEELPNLISICPNNYYTVCPSLQRILLNHVELSIPTSNILKGGSEDTQWDYASTKDLEATIMKLVQNFDVGNSDFDEHFIGKENDLLLLREMILQNQQEIKYLCISPKRLLNLQNLLKLIVHGCGKLKAMFSVSVLRSLPQLKDLIITECEELEQITIEEQENENMSNPYSQKGCFPQLKVLYIECCNKLKRLFSISMSQEFPKLEYIVIKEASHLEEVFESEKGETEERKEVVLPQLKYLILVQLPSLTNVYHGIEFQTVRNRVVQNCPNLYLTTALQKSIEDLENEIYDDLQHHEIYDELVDILSDATKETFNEDPMVESEVSNSENKATSWSEPPFSQGVVDGIQEGLLIEKAKTVASSSQINLMEQQKSITSEKRPQLVSDADGPNMVPATHVGVEDGEPVLDQPQQLISPPPVLSVASPHSDTVSSNQPQSITMPLSSGQTFEEPALPAPASIPNFELDPLDELESLLTDSSFSTSTNTAPFQSPTKRLSIQRMAEDLDALFDKEVDDLYNDPAILERLAQISSISESMTASDAPSTFVHFMKNFRSIYPRLLKDFEKNKKAMLQYEKVKTEKDNMVAGIPTIRGKKKELEDNIRRAEFVDKTFSDQIAELKRQLVEVESRAQAHKIVLSSLHLDRTKIDRNTQALIEKARKITHFINSNSLVYTENRVNLASLRNGWTELKSQFVQSRGGL